MNGKNIHFKEGKAKHRSIAKTGNAMGTCATFNETYLCCRVHVLRSVHNCPYECSYCFLQNYLTDGSTKVVEDIAPLMQEVRENISREPGRLFRIGTWELGDSLALEKQTGQAAKLVAAFSGLDNAVLELKTKSGCVDSLLHLDHKGKTVVSWSLNPEIIIRAEEHCTASLRDRLNAMAKVFRAGYLIGLHFDPMIFHRDWEAGYSDLVRKVFECVSPDRVAWVSIGSLRFNPEMKKKMENNYPQSRLTCAEMVQGSDGKMRYVKPLRISMYRHLCNQLNKHLNSASVLYLCMERWDVWDRVLGNHPDSTGYLDYLFAKSLFERYGIGAKAPQEQLYNQMSFPEQPGNNV